jgi:hypothetical protein
MLHVTVWDGLLVPVTSALSVVLPPRLTVAPETVTDVTLDTVTLAVADLLESASDVALIVRGLTVSSWSTYSLPPSIFVPAFVPFVTLHVTAVDKRLVSLFAIVTEAATVLPDVFPRATFVGALVIETLFTVGMSTVFSPYMLVPAAVALTVRLSAVSAWPIESFPSLVMLVPPP